MSNAALLATRYARRPLLIEPHAAEAILRHISAADPRGLPTEGRVEAFLRRLGVGRGRPQAFDQEQEAEASENAVRRPSAYAPLWAQQAYGDPTDEGFAWALFQGVAMMEVATPLAERGEEWCGTWYHGYDTLLAGMRDALADERVKGLFIRMNSPGGPVSGGLPALSAFMRKARASAGGKPIWVYADMACSAAYWCSAPADRVVGPQFALVGSIGAVILHEDYSGAMAKAGLVITPIQFGSQKTAGAWWETLSPAARDDLQAEIDQCGRDFVADVAASRPKLTPEALLATQARVFMGQHDETQRSGLALGFLDAVLGEEDAFAELLEHVSAPGDVRASNSGPMKLAATSQTKEHPDMANQARKDARTAALLASASTLVAPQPAAPAAEHVRPAAAAPDDGMIDCETCGGTGENPDGSDCEDCGGEGQVPDPDLDPEAKTPAAEPTAAAEPVASDVEAISASAEAKAHPALALEAISAKMSLAQFQAMAKVAAAPARGGALREAMAGARRLGADITGKPDAGLGSMLVADARARADKARG